MLEGKHKLMGFYNSLRTMIEARMKIPKDAQHVFYSLASVEISPGEPGLITKDLWAEPLLFVAAGKSPNPFYTTSSPNEISRGEHHIHCNEWHFLLPVAESRSVRPISL